MSFESGEDFQGTEFGLFFSDDLVVSDRLKVNWGGRLSGWNNAGSSYTRLEPRFSANYSLADNWSVKASYARMNQYVHLLASSGLSLPTDIWYPSTGSVKPEKSDQIAVGTSFLVRFDKSIAIGCAAIPRFRAMVYGSKFRFHCSSNRRQVLG